MVYLDPVAHHLTPSGKKMAVEATGPTNRIVRHRTPKKKEKTMQAIEFETRIDKDGHLYVPKEFQHTYGKNLPFRCSSAGTSAKSFQEKTTRKRRGDP